MSNRPFSGPIVVDDGQNGPRPHLLRVVPWTDGNGRRDRFASSQSRTASAYDTGLPAGRDPNATFLYGGNGTVLTMSQGIVARLTRLGVPWRTLGRRFGLGPSRPLDAGDDRVARPPRDRETRISG
ncbi:hypothetical protein ACQVP2_10930 [Methylobacterium aquaticum]|uniref:hypothetical protein n=1 Tax=Methylobacterium aquaticum TaxID=270351 RepID=UPI003D174CE3